MDEQLKKRILSWAWRTGALLLVVLISNIVELLPELGLPEITVAVIGLILGEITKYLNKKYQFGRKVLGSIYR